MQQGHISNHTREREQAGAAPVAYENNVRGVLDLMSDEIKELREVIVELEARFAPLLRDLQESTKAECKSNEVSGETREGSSWVYRTCMERIEEMKSLRRHLVSMIARCHM